MKEKGILVVITLLLAGCAGGPLTTREQFTYGGGVLGAGTGAIIGAASGSAVTGAAIGGPVGAVAGYLIGDSLQGGTLPVRGGETRRPSSSRVGGYEKTPPHRAHKETKPTDPDRDDEEGGRVF